MKRGASGPCGILAIDKPADLTSHDVVNRVRHITGERRVGHAGTLDPMATGLLLVAVGAATRLSSYLTGHDKAYRARIVLGVATDTDDAEGRVLARSDCSGAPSPAALAADVDPREVVASLVGPCEQLPPAYSAIKKNGITAYKAAREGRALELEPRMVRILAAALVGTGVTGVDLDDGAGGRFVAKLPYWDVDLHVSKGTYIRSIARDLGVRLGCGAHLGALRRTAIADLSLDQAHTIDELESIAGGRGQFPWADPARLLGFPVLELDEGQVADVANGRELVSGPRGAARVSCVAEGRLLAVYENVKDRLRPATVIPGGVVGVA